MDTIRASDVRQLASVEHGHCVSIYMPTFPGGIDEFQDHVRLKVLLDRAEQQLIERGMDSVIARKMLVDPRAIAHDDAWWHDRSQGLALFVSPDQFKALRLAGRVRRNRLGGTPIPCQTALAAGYRGCRLLRAGTQPQPSAILPGITVRAELKSASPDCPRTKSTHCTISPSIAVGRFTPVGWGAWASRRPSIMVRGDIRMLNAMSCEASSEKSTVRGIECCVRNPSPLLLATVESQLAGLSRSEYLRPAAGYRGRRIG